MDKLHIINANVNPRDTLDNAWRKFSTALRDADALETQIDAMEMAFFMGAAQVFTNIDAAGKEEPGMPPLIDVMKRLYADIDKVMTKRNILGDTQGNA